MAIIDEFTLISGAPFFIDGVCHLVPPTLAKIRDETLSTYQSYVGLLLLQKNEVCELLTCDTKDVESLNLLQLVTMIPELRCAYLSALGFFISEGITYDEEIGYTTGDGSKSISLELLWRIRSGILQLCCVPENEKAPPLKFRNAKAKERYERMQMLRERNARRRRAMPPNADMALPNLISAVAAYSSTYNLLNIWELTLYQFYDQFARLNGKNELDVIGLRWAAWGKDEFDFSLWHKAMTPSNKS